MYTISADLLKAVVNYLAAKPFNEVAPLVQALTQLPLLVAEEAEESEEVEESDEVS